MASSYYKPLRERVRLAVQYWCARPEDITAVAKIMKKKNPDCESLEPRVFAKLARRTMSDYWDIKVPQRRVT